MEHRGVVITAGFNKSKSAVAIAELLKSKGISINGFIVVSPYSWKRLQSYIKKRGPSFLLEAIPRILGLKTSEKKRSNSYFDEFREKKNFKIESIRKWASINNANYVSVRSINSRKAQYYLEKVLPEWLVYSGGGIIRENIIQLMDGRILNAHHGPLPEVRGMNAAEWSILLDEKQEVTIHIIDKGIDTGKIIKRLPFEVCSNDTISSIREKAKIKGIEGVVEVASKQDLRDYKIEENSADHLQCYILSSTMKELLNEKLSNFQRIYE